MQRMLVRVDGSELPLPRPVGGEEICQLIGARILHSVALESRDGRPVWVMVVDDTAWLDGRPLNERATELYRRARPGTPHRIYGDVVIAPDGDWDPA